MRRALLSTDGVEGMETCSKSSREDVLGEPGCRDRLDKSGGALCQPWHGYETYVVLVHCWRVPVIQIFHLLIAV
jgi:hypothetical protein